MDKSATHDKHAADASPVISEARPSSSTEITQALTPYLSSGPSGLAVRIGRKEISLKREQRVFTAPRNVKIDDLIEAAVDLTGPLTQEEAETIFEPYSRKGIAMRIEGDTAFFTRDAHNAQFKTHDGKVKIVPMRKRVVRTSLDVPMAHLISVLDEMTGGGEMFE